MLLGVLLVRLLSLLLVRLLVLLLVRLLVLLLVLLVRRGLLVVRARLLRLLLLVRLLLVRLLLVRLLLVLLPVRRAPGAAPRPAPGRPGICRAPGVAALGGQHDTLVRGPRRGKVRLWALSALRHRDSYV
ncbi:hypothetical protein GCM10010274_19260 [Streptomyces lavendofoliae]|uniref:Uncharacterized protein n=1 Tax=Streptomyces lavendofoliae TaxID=67314 RepID=A0A918M3W3_9ACTN|nr:hypothetical protein GCM10010274_19260 [Streptomyces lavendofoliae]